MATMPNGRYVISWQTDTTNWDVRAQVFKQGGSEPLGSEIAVNTTTSGVQGWHHIGVFADNSFVIAWEDAGGKDGSGSGIFGQWFTSTGAPVGGEKQLNVEAAGSQKRPDVKVLSTNDLIVSWHRDGDGAAFIRRFDSAGKPKALANPEFAVNATTAGDQVDPAVAATPDGSFLATWASQGVDGDGAAVVVRRYSAGGVPAAGEGVVNTFTKGDQLAPSIATAGDGGSVIVWDSVGQDGDIDGIFGQRFDKEGKKLGGEFPLNQTTANEQQRPAVAVFSTGKFAAAWESYGQQGGSGYDIALRCYGSDGVPAGNEMLANSVTADKQIAPSLAAFQDGSGKFALAWQSNLEDGGGFGIRAALFYQDCTQILVPFAVNTTTNLEQSQPRVAFDAKTGGFVIVWRSDGQDGSGFGIYAQRFDGLGAKVGSEWKINPVTFGEQSRPTVAIDKNGIATFAWQTASEDNDGFAVKIARYDGPQQVGLDWMANLTFTGAQQTPALAVRPDGSAVLLWNSIGQDGDKGTAIGRLFQ